LFYFKNGILFVNKSVLYPNHNILDLYEFRTRTLERDSPPVLTACEFKGIERVSDTFYTYTESIIKEDGPFNMLIKHDFVRVKCLLNSTVNLIVSKDHEIEKNSDDSFNKEVEEESESKRSIFEESLVDFDQFLVQVHPQEDVYKRASGLQNLDQMNVMIIVLDSMSHMSFRRKLPKTYSYLKRNLAATIMNGYNIVGDATLSSLIPLLTGKLL
jgi:hypothetical protein